MSGSFTASVLTTRTTLRSALSADAARLLRVAAVELIAADGFAADPRSAAEAYVAATFADLPDEQQAIVVALLLDDVERCLVASPADGVALTRTRAAELEYLRAVAVIAELMEQTADASEAIVANLG